MTYETLTIDGQKVGLRRWGSGPAVLVLHGWGSSSQPWEPVALLLEKQGYEIIVPDLPGFGESDPPKEVWGVDGYAEFILHLCASLQINSCRLVAHSFGGRIALRLASTGTFGIEQLVLCSAAGLRPQDLKSRIKRVVYRVLAKAGKAVSNVPLLSGFQPAARKILYRGAGEHDYERTQGIMKKVFVAVIQEDMADDLPQVHVPVLLVWGATDRLTPLRDGELMHANIAGSVLRVIPDLGHNAYRDAPGQTAGYILDFFKAEQ